MPKVGAAKSTKPNGICPWKVFIPCRITLAGAFSWPNAAPPNSLLAKLQEAIFNMSLSLKSAARQTTFHAMSLSLTDPRWNELQSSYGGTEDVIAWLAEAHQEGGLSSQRLGDLINEVQHQGDTSAAMYAVAPHLIDLARRVGAEEALPLLTHAGIIYACSTSSGAVPCPNFLQDEFKAYATDGAKLLAPLLPSATHFDAYKWAVAGLAGFLGHHPFARFLDGLDYYEGQFHHAWLDEPFPPET